MSLPSASQRIMMLRDRIMQRANAKRGGISDASRADDDASATRQQQQQQQQQQQPATARHRLVNRLLDRSRIGGGGRGARTLSRRGVVDAGGRGEEENSNIEREAVRPEKLRTFLPADEVAAPRSLCLFACHAGKGGDLTANKRLYIGQLTRHFERTLVLVNDDAHACLGKTGDTVDVPEKRAGHVAVLVRLPNNRYDFGMFWRVLFALVKEPTVARRLERVGLVNDSCTILRDLRDVFAWAEETRKKKRGAAAEKETETEKGNERPQEELPPLFWGTSLSYSPTRHLQSFFLVFDGARAVELLFRFAAERDVFSVPSRTAKMHIIKGFELGLSEFMQEAGLPGDSPYSTYTAIQRHRQERGEEEEKKDDRCFLGNNCAHHYWDCMLAAGCPVVKNNCKVLGSREHSERLTHEAAEDKYKKTLASCGFVPRCAT